MEGGRHAAARAVPLPLRRARAPLLRDVRVATAERERGWLPLLGPAGLVALRGLLRAVLAPRGAPAAVTFRT